MCLEGKISVNSTTMVNNNTIPHHTAVGSGFVINNDSGGFVQTFGLLD